MEKACDRPEPEPTKKEVLTCETKNRGLHLAQNAGERKFWQGMILYVGSVSQMTETEKQALASGTELVGPKRGMGVQREASWVEL